VEIDDPGEPHLDGRSAWKPETEVLQNERVDHRHVSSVCSYPTRT
jgi:hypothetical protein